MDTASHGQAYHPSPEARRLLEGMLRDARRLADAGIAGPADIDTAMRLGAGHQAGPFAILGGDAAPAQAGPALTPSTGWTGPVAMAGSGLMAAGIAEAVARSGREVRVLARTLGSFERLCGRVAASTRRQVKRGRLNAQEAEAAVAAIRHSEPEAVGLVDVLIEAVTEDLSVKTEVMAALDGVLDSAIPFATNTSSYRVADLSTAVPSGRPVLALHFFNPAPVMKLVEVVAPASLEPDAVGWVAALGKTAVRCADTRGFVVNRLLIPFLNDAVAAHAAGTPAERIDRIMTEGAAHPMGPLALIDLIGVDVVVATLNSMAATDPEARLQPAPMLRAMVEGGRLGRKTGRGFYEYS